MMNLQSICGQNVSGGAEALGALAGLAGSPAERTVSGDQAGAAEAGLFAGLLAAVCAASGAAPALTSEHPVEADGGSAPTTGGAAVPASVGTLPVGQSTTTPVAAGNGPRGETAAATPEATSPPAGATGDAATSKGGEASAAPAAVPVSPAAGPSPASATASAAGLAAASATATAAEPAENPPTRVVAEATGQPVGNRSGSAPGSPGQTLTTELGAASTADPSAATPVGAAKAAAEGGAQGSTAGSPGTIFVPGVRVASAKAAPGPAVANGTVLTVQEEAAPAATAQAAGDDAGKGGQATVAPREGQWRETQEAVAVEAPARPAEGGKTGAGSTQAGGSAEPGTVADESRVAKREAAGAGPHPGGAQPVANGGAETAPKSALVEPKPTAVERRLEAVVPEEKPARAEGANTGDGSPRVPEQPPATAAPGTEKPAAHQASQAGERPEVARPPVRAEVRELPQVVRRAELVGGDGAPRELRVQLVPEHLGRLTIRVTVEESGVSARLMVENPEVKALVEQRMPELERALRDQGMRLTGFSVDCGDARQGGDGYFREEVRQQFRSLSGPAGAERYAELAAGPGEDPPGTGRTWSWTGSGGVLDALI